MKLLLILLFSVTAICSHAQNCSNHTLFKKGVQLEYDCQLVQLGGTTKKVMRLLFEVTGVEERNGSTYSTIVKKGYSSNSDQHFERTIELECDGKNLLIPFDFYSADTIYLKDVYPEMKLAKKGYALAYTPLKNDATFNVPLSLEGAGIIPVGVKRYVQKVRHVTMSNYGSTSKVDHELLMTIRTIRLIGKETVSTAAGNFDCYKFSVEGDQEGGRLNMQLKYFLYFNNEVGMVKYDGPGGLVELTSIKK